MPGERAVINARLLRSCALLWALGLAGMWFARAVLVLEPHALFFQAAAALWILGGTGYTGLGLLGLASAGRVEVPQRGAEPADLSAMIRRR